MNEVELERFKNSNPQHNIIHIVSAIYEYSPDSVESIVFYKDALGINTVNREIYPNNEDPQTITYEEKSKALCSEIDNENAYTRKYIFENKKDTQEMQTAFRKQITSRCITLYKNLQEIGFEEELQLTQDNEQEYIKNRKDLEIEEFISKKCSEDMGYYEIYQDFLNKYEIDEKKIKKFFEDKKVKLHSAIKSWY